MMTCPAPSVDACTGGGASNIACRLQGNPIHINAAVVQKLHQAEQFLQIIEQLNSATTSLEKAWSGTAAQSAVQKMMSTISSFMQIVSAIEKSASLLGVSSGLIASAQTVYNTVFSWVDPTVRGLLSDPWTYAAGEALASISTATVGGYVTLVEAALHFKGWTEMMQQVAILYAIAMDIQRLAGGGNAAAEASALISLYRAGKQEYKTLNPSSSAALSTGSCAAPAPAPAYDIDYDEADF